MGWRPGIWAGFFGGAFLTALGMAVTWIAVSRSAVHPLPWWPLIIFGVLGAIGVGGLLLSIYKPHRLPGHKKHLEELERHQKEEVALSARKARAAGNVGMTGPINSESINRRQTDAMNRLASAMERQEQRQSDSSDDASRDST